MVFFSINQISSSNTQSSISSASDSESIESQICSSAVSKTSSLYDSESSTSMLSPKKKPVHESPLCFFDPLTCQRQSFSIPDKIVYYIAKNATNAETSQKLVETCKYFFRVNPVIVVPTIQCKGDMWYACHNEDEKYRIGFKYDQPINFKIWVTQKFSSFFGNASQVIPAIYKNDANVVDLKGEPLKFFEDFLYIVGNTEVLFMGKQLVENENGEAVQLEDIVKSLPKLKTLDYFSDGINANTASKLMEIEHFKNISLVILRDLPEAFNVEAIFNYIIENKRNKVFLRYSEQISNQCKQLIREYSNRLKNEEGCKSSITYIGMGWDIIFGLAAAQNYSSDDDDGSDTSFDSFDDGNVYDDDESEDILFPWNNEEDEEWGLPWDIEE